MSQSDYYKLGGNLAANHPTYIQRHADAVLYLALQARKFCYVFDARQMGKSSLRLQTMAKLQSEGIVCAAVDLTAIGTGEVTLEKWYLGLIDRLVGDPSLNLQEVSELTPDLNTWWLKHSLLSSVQRFRKFIEEILLKYVVGNIVIFFDEIDSVLSLEFSNDDFFATIRDCEQSRATNPDYNRLTFCLVGAANPSNLIQDRRRTPFNIGESVLLDGFTLDEAQPLIPGLTEKAEDSQEVLRRIIEWTGGQPFLTQKLCKLVSTSERRISRGTESERIGALVQSSIIEDWEEQDDPVHLTTIRDRILLSRLSPSQLLSLYQQIFEYGQIPADNTPEQTELRLSGLVAKKDGKLEVYNPIYRAIFNESWIRSEIAKRRPYEEAINAWLASSRAQDSRLLQGKALRDALSWAEGKKLSDEDKQFLKRSQDTVESGIDQILELLAKAEGPEIAEVLRKFVPELKKLADRPVAVIREIVSWAGTDQFLTTQICQLLVTESSGSEEVSISEGEEAERVTSIAQTHIIQNWEIQVAGEHLGSIRDAIAGHVKSVDLLELYQRVLLKEEIATDTSELAASLSGLVEKQEGKLKVSNRIYENVFNQEWIDQELEKAKNRRIIYGHYEVIKDLEKGEFTQTYLVQDRYNGVESVEKFVIKQLTPVSTDKTITEETKTNFDFRYRELKRISGANGSAYVPELIDSFEEDHNHYFVQKFIDGSRLDEEIRPEVEWDELKVIQLLVETLEVLNFVHERDVTHRNLKPSNLMRRRQDQKIVLIDFAFLKEIVASTASSKQSLQFQQSSMSEYMPPDGPEGWTPFALDIYAVGMIGIQLITGSDPQDLNRDKKTGEYLWNINLIRVRPELAEILTKMVRHNSEGRYQQASEVINDLNALEKVYDNQVSNQPVSYPWFKDKRMIIGSVCGLLIVSGLSYGWFRESQLVKDLNQKISGQEEAQKQKSQSLANDKCHEELKSKKSRGIDIETIRDAGVIIDSCKNSASSPISSDNSLPLSKAKALLILSKGSSQLKQEEDGKRYLKEARTILLQSPALKNDPQINFYLGLVKRLLSDSSYKDNYAESIKLYLARMEQVTKGEDYIILSMLGSFLGKDSFTTANKLYENSTKAIPDKINKNYKGNLYYNWLTLEGRANNSKPKINKIISEAQNVDSNNKYIETYSKYCTVVNAETIYPVCQLNTSTLPRITPVYACKDYPALAISEDLDRKNLCE